MTLLIGFIGLVLLGLVIAACIFWEVVKFIAVPFLILFGIGFIYGIIGSCKK